MIRRLRLRNFRSHKDLEIKLDEGVNAIVGPNGVGKTNVLEAVYFTSLGKSFRGKVPELIRRGQEWSKVELDTEDAKYTSVIDNRGDRLNKSFSIGYRSGRFKPAELPVVLFEPEQLRMFTAGPELRRAYLDELLSLLDPKYDDSIKRHQRLISQRNRLLKQPKLDKDTLFVIDLKLGEYGAVVDRARKKLVDILNLRASDIYSHIAPESSKIRFEYSSSVTKKGDYAANYLKLAERNRQRDLATGFSSGGVHRDDLLSSINEGNVQQTASRGETRTMAVTAKLIEVALIEEKLGKRPTLLLDDVLSELDTQRQNRLLKIIGGGQTIIAATNAERGLENIQEL